jgi:glycerate kinase
VRVLVAPDKFKGSLTAGAAGDAIAAGLRLAQPRLEVLLAPVADGGDGTVDAAVAAGFQRVTTTVTGPIGQPVVSGYALREETAVIELAEASGLRRLPNGRTAPLTATTFGTGELIRAALERGARRVVVGVGGSATSDGGVGMAQALGVRFLNRRGEDVGPGGAALRDLETISVDGLDPRVRSAELIVASDVQNPLLGPSGAAAVYAPQKGADASDVAELEKGLGTLASVVARQFGVDLAAMPGAGAAGGAGGGAVAFLGARIVSGIDYLLDLIGLPELLRSADLVITGEGSLDEQTLHGKAPAGVAAAARAAGKEVVAVCGRLALPPEALGRAGIRRAYPLTEAEPDIAKCLSDAGPILERVAEDIGRDFLA